MINSKEQSDRRRIDDWQSIETLARQLPWFHAQMVPDPKLESGQPPKIVPLRIEITIDGTGIIGPGSGNDRYELSEQHQIQIELPDDYPNTPPKIQMVSSLFHPNVAPSGLIQLGEIGVNWQPDLTLDIICERVWDVIRGAYVDLESVANVAALERYAVGTPAQIPVDSRALAVPVNRLPNVIKYQRKDQPTRLACDAESDKEMFYIRDPNHSNDVPINRSPRAQSVDSHQPPQGGIHFIQ